jgi:hypothetical protein
VPYIYILYVCMYVSMYKRIYIYIYNQICVHLRLEVLGFQEDCPLTHLSFHQHLLLMPHLV